MIIDLPDHLFLQKGVEYVYVVNGEMEIFGHWQLERIMKICTLEMQNKNRCYYCGKYMTSKEVTVEHMYPKAYGGPSVTTNFVLSCQNCNQKKGVLNTYEYGIWKELGKDERKRYYQEVVHGKNKRMDNPEIMGYDVPKSWYSINSIKDIGIDTTEYVIKSKKKCKYYYRALAFAEKTRKILGPLVVSSNGFLICGKIDYFVALQSGIDYVPTITLENVSVL